MTKCPECYHFYNGEKVNLAFSCNQYEKRLLDLWSIMADNGLDDVDFASMPL